MSSKPALNAHFRYVLPALPFLFILVSHRVAPLHSARRQRQPAKAYIFKIAVIAYMCSSMYTYPHSLSYFNELVGGPTQGRKHLLGSNVDWGQDLRYFKWWLEEKGIEESAVALAYHGPLNPTMVGIHDVQSWSGESIDLSTKAISINLLWGKQWAARDGVSPSSLMDDKLVHQYRNENIWKRIGYSIIVFRDNP